MTIATHVCPFCEIIAGDPHRQILRRLHGCIVFEPLNPVVAGHLLVVPEHHVANATEDPGISAQTMMASTTVAAEIGSCNIITSVGANATQTVMHLHIHIVLHTANDGLALPWAPNS